jgi:hypothetical protein
LGASGFLKSGPTTQPVSNNDTASDDARIDLPHQFLEQAPACVAGVRT